jgi:hypothetical protein
MDLNYTCPHCHMEARNLRSTDHILERPKFDDLYVCGGCHTLSKVGVISLILVTSEEFDAFDEETRKELNFAMRAIVRNIRNQ